MTVHLLLTRFNVLRSSAHGPAGDDWLRRRLDLFRRYTLPCVNGQSAPPDRWLLFCGPSPAWLIEELEAIQAGSPVLRPVFSEEPFAPETVVTAVRDELDAGAETLITTRLDSDDAIARDYLQAVRSAASGHTFGFLNFTHGLQLSRGRLYRRSDPSNAFISCIEPASRAGTVFAGQHQALSEHGPLVQVRERDMWMQVIHGDNLANVARGIRVSPSRAAGYPLELGLEPTPRWRLAAEQALGTLRLLSRIVRSPSRVRWAWRVLRAR